MAEKTSANKNAAPFFVGYLPMPAALKKFYWPLAAALILASGFSGFWVAAQQKSTAAASWNSADVTAMQGVLTLTPYPILHRVHAENPGEVESVLLVRQGKHAVNRLSASFDRQAVVINGYRIARGGWTMLEIAGDDAITAIAPAHGASGDEAGDDKTRAALASKPLGAISLQGEIVDSKCFLGVMKPGAGGVHKACAEVCLLGGIPPMLVAKDAQNQQFGYLLTRADGSSAAEWLAKFAAEPVRISGQLQQQGDMLFIRVDEDGIQRI